MFDEIELTIPHPAIMVGRRPIMSARSPAMRAPKKVPAERMETIKEVVELEMAVAWGPAMAWMNSDDERTPLMYPESYPKKIPPNEAKAHLETVEKQWSADASKLKSTVHESPAEATLTSCTP